MQVGEFAIGHQIGEGAFSKVCLCLNQHTGETNVIKIIKKDGEEAIKAVQQLQREVSVLSQINHPNIVKYYQFIEDETYSYIVMERIEGESMLDFVNNHPLQEERVCQDIFYQICRAIQYLHQRGIAHRDLKLDNIMIDNQYKVKLLDFGLCNFQDSTHLMTTFCGSLCNAPPEIINKTPYDGFAADMWSLGVVLFSLLTKQLPWPMGNQVAMVQAIRCASYVIPNFVPEKAQEIIKGLIRLNPEERWTIKQVLDDQWMSLENRYGLNSTPLQTTSLMTLPSLHPPRPARRRQRYSNVSDLESIKNLGSSRNYAEGTPNISSRTPAPPSLVRPVATPMSLKTSVLTQNRPMAKITAQHLRYKSSSVKPFNLVQA